jgi:hypothetical protein
MKVILMHNRYNREPISHSAWIYYAVNADDTHGHLKHLKLSFLEGGISIF